METHHLIYDAPVPSRYTVAEWYGAGFATARSRVRIPPLAAVCQRQLSVPSLRGRYQRKLGSKRAYHAIHWPRIRGLAASAGVRLRANETEISAAPWALRLMKGLYFFYLSYTIITFKSPVSPFP